MGLRNRFRGWIPKNTSYPVQGTGKLNTEGYFAKVTMAMRLVYGLALVAYFVHTVWSLSFSGRTICCRVTLGL
jgi:hypothetical protein